MKKPLRPRRKSATPELDRLFAAITDPEWYVYPPTPQSSGWGVSAEGRRAICSMHGRAYYGDEPIARENAQLARAIALLPLLVAATRQFKLTDLDPALVAQLESHAVASRQITEAHHDT